MSHLDVATSVKIHPFHIGAAGILLEIGIIGLDQQQYNKHEALSDTSAGRAQSFN